MARIGVFGGSFNPPHLGHTQAVLQAQRELSLDRVLLIPAATPPHKTLPDGSPDPETRLALTKLAVAGLPRAEVSDIELRRTGPSYTADTLAELAAQYPDDELVLLLGTDMFLTLHQWVRPDEICRFARIACAARTDAPQAALEMQAQRLETELNARVSVLHNEVLELSSTTVRRMLAFGCAEGLLAPAVLAEIRRLGLYRRPDTLRHLTLPELEAACTGLLDAKRVPHVLGCRDTAVLLAERYGGSVTDAARAGLLHDVTKALPHAQQLQLCRHYGMIPSDYAAMQPQLLHALTGALAAEHVFGESPEVCSAIRWHTTGKPDMAALEKILYLADYMEPTRSFDGVEPLRQAVLRDLDEGLLLGMTMSVDELRQSGRPVAEDTIRARDWLLDSNPRGAAL